MRMNRRSKEALRDSRALEKMERHSQLDRYSNQLIPSDPSGLPHKMRGGGDAGLARIVGKGRRKMKKEEEEMSSDEELEGGRKFMGKMLAKHLMDQHGEKYLKKFAKGLMRGGAGIDVEHSFMSPAGVGERGSALGGQDVPPGGVAPQAYGSPPQAPASFQRNTVGMGMLHIKHEGGAMPKGAGKLEITHGGAKPKRSNARGQMISKLMKEKGMSLPEASRFLKEHGSA